MYPLCTLTVRNVIQKQYVIQFSVLFVCPAFLCCSYCRGLYWAKAFPSLGKIRCENLLLHLLNLTYTFAEENILVLGNCHSPTQHQLVFKAFTGNSGSWFSVCNIILTQLNKIWRFFFDYWPLSQKSTLNQPQLALTVSNNFRWLCWEEYPSTLHEYSWGFHKKM